MELYLLRHAIAEDRSATGRDADRKLTAEGLDKLRHVARLAAAAGVKPSLILSSPYVRAVETAAATGRVLEYKEEILKTDRLTPGASPSDAWAELRAHRGEESILLVGHEPLFSALASWMLGSARVVVDFRKSALVRIDFQTLGAEPRGVLRWMITPKLAEAAREDD
ncbi:MAG TPA: phosphohistidine phosphatase SixA [Bryobacteraceae bacterium]|nr:phosphohistidine phosphatase SixA [Bryobacteraceae bacterium]